MLRYVITDSLATAQKAAREGATMIQLRAKSLPTRTLLHLAHSFVTTIKIPILINTRLDIALSTHAQGIHLPANSIPPYTLRKITPHGFLVGVSCHTISELQTAQREGADFAVYGPVFTSPTKPVSPIGLDALFEATRSVALPIYALGGVTEENAPLCMEAGAAGIAGISLFT